MRKQSEYSKKLRDPRWQKTRLKIFERDKFTCLACGAKDVTLAVHHLQYNGDPWDTPDEYMLTTCENCHAEFEDMLKAMRLLIPYHWEEFLMIRSLMEDQNDSLFSALSDISDPRRATAFNCLHLLLFDEFCAGSQWGAANERASQKQ